MTRLFYSQERHSGIENLADFRRGTKADGIQQHATQEHATQALPPNATWGFVTVAKGDRVAVWDRNGGVEIIAGPQSFLNLGNKVEALQSRSADALHYLRCLPHRRCQD